jgi:hypothetical protein
VNPRVVTLLVVTRAGSIGAARLGLLICLTFLAMFGVMVLVGELRRKSKARSDATTASTGARPGRGA